jgi:hypothetical protein
MWLLTLMAAVGPAGAFANSTRFVHRHTCFGSGHNNSYDTIGCAEREATLFEHTLTPAMLWCNATHCQTTLGDALDVHMIDCDAQRCRVLLHCDAKFASLKQAFAITIVALVLLVAAMTYHNALPLIAGRHENLKTL